MKTKRQHLINLRKTIGTQNEVAKRLGISTIYLRKIESGTCNPGRDVMFRFSEFFNEPLEYLFPDFFEGKY